MIQNASCEHYCIYFSGAMKLFVALFNIYSIVFKHSMLVEPLILHVPRV